MKIKEKSFSLFFFLLLNLKKELVFGEIQKNSDVWLKNLLAHTDKEAYVNSLDYGLEPWGNSEQFTSFMEAREILVFRLWGTHV